MLENVSFKRKTKLAGESESDFSVLARLTDLSKLGNGILFCLFLDVELRGKGVLVFRRLSLGSFFLIFGL